MAHKSRPPPLKDLQIALQVDQSRRYLVLDTPASLPSPAYPFPPVCVQADAGDYRWHDSLDGHDVRSFTPPISPPLRGQDTAHASKRSGRTFALVPAQVDGRHVFTHVVVNPNDDPTISPKEDGLPEDMQDMLGQLDDLASWVKAASSSRSRDVTSITLPTRLPGHPATSGHNAGKLSDGLFFDKGKNRLLSTSPPSDCDAVNHSRRPVTSSPIKSSPAVNCISGSEGFIYVPDCDTPEFLVGSSSSPVAYPVYGYSSHPSRHPHLPDASHDTPYPHRSLGRRSAPCPPSASPIISPPSGKASFKTLFQRSRCNTNAVVRPSIPSGHVPVENALRQGKRMRLPWLRI